MASDQLIPAGEFCTYHHVELSFLQNLHDSGLIALTIRNGAFFLDEEQLVAVEKFARWHYELAINPEGIEALSHVLERFDQLLAENQRLRTRLNRWEKPSASGTTLEYEP